MILIRGDILLLIPIGLAGGVNLYGYVLNDPENWIDPWGLQGGYPYYPSWSDVRAAGHGAVSATQQGVGAAVDLTVSGPAPARYTLQGALVIAGAPVVEAGSGIILSATNIAYFLGPHSEAIVDYIFSTNNATAPIANIPGGFGVLTGLLIDWFNGCP